MTRQNCLICQEHAAAGFSGLTDDEAAGVGRALARWSRALERSGAEHVYVHRIVHAVPHLHVHLVPRWVGTPPDIPWTQVDEWDGARRGTFEHAAAVTEELRRLAQ